MAFIAKEALDDVMSISAKFKTLKEGHMTLQKWLNDIFLREFFDATQTPTAEIYEAKDAKLTYIPALQTFNILIYVAEEGRSKEVCLPLGVALEETVGCADVFEARKHLQLI